MDTSRSGPELWRQCIPQVQLPGESRFGWTYEYGLMLLGECLPVLQKDASLIMKMGGLTLLTTRTTLFLNRPVVFYSQNPSTTSECVFEQPMDIIELVKQLAHGEDTQDVDESHPTVLPFKGYRIPPPIDEARAEELGRNTGRWWHEIDHGKNRWLDLRSRGGLVEDWLAVCPIL
ncbi:hypothetical protein K474DRAFT_1438840 [Panus rudis PR-1116 ss-1]|nr:hypothetical protein K474DRAFT_1438840 [Panus rudis PR-1116 ss-1]